MMKGLALPVLYSLVVSQAPPELVVSVGHAGAPTRAAFVGPYMATAAWSNVAIVDLSSGLTVAQLPQRSLVMALEGSPAGDLLAVGTCDHAIQLWDVDSWTLVRGIALVQECAESLSFSPDGALLATGAYGCCDSGKVKDKGLQIWDIRTGELVRVLAEDAGIRHVVFSGDGRWVAGVDDEGNASVFEWPSGRELRKLTGFEDSGSSGSSVIASHDGKYFAWVGPRSGLEIWDVVSEDETVPRTRRVDVLEAAEFLDDGRLAYIDRGDMVLTRLPNGPQERIPVESESKPLVDVWMMQSLRIKRDASLVAGRGREETLVWDVTAGRLYEPTSPALISPRSVRWVQSGVVAWVGLGSGAGGWDDRRGELVDFDDDLNVANAIAFRPDGKQLAIAGFPSMAIVDLPSRRTTASLKSGPSAGTAVAFSPDGSRLAFALPGRGFALFDSRLRTRGTIAALEQYTKVEHVTFSPDGRWIAAGIGGHHPALRVWSVDEIGSGVAVELDANRITYGPQPTAFRSDSQWLASFRRGASLTIWNTASWDVERTWTLSGTGQDLAFAPEGSRLAVASDGEAAIWDAAAGEKIVSFSTPGSAEMDAIAWSPDGDCMVASADDGVLRFWDAHDGRLLASLYVLASGDDWLLVAPDGRIDGSERALTRLVAWRVGERVALDERLMREHRVPGLWRSLSN